ncbi:PucR family transcriptional regulator [Millisia brevis]|uniref:PucR family transcriptional regulator n=1 Tax=Millisia brevis TaxID=264148 RepID=UPI0008354BF8|nr:PucR family transcriptional regulator [Millisia brevis]
MTDSVNVDFTSQVQSIVDTLSQALDRAVLLDDEELTSITHSRQLGRLDDLRLYSVLQRGTLPEAKSRLLGFGIRTATEPVRMPAVPEHGQMARWCVPIRSAERRLGYLWILDPDDSLSEEGRGVAVRAGADLAALLDRHNGELRAEELSKQALLERLLSDSDRERVQLELQARGMAQPDSRFSVFTFDSGASDVAALDGAIALRLRLAALDRSHQWFPATVTPTVILAVSRPDASIDTEATIDAVLEGIEASYGIRPAVGWSGDRYPGRQVTLGVQRARLALTLGQIGVSDARVTVWTRLGSWQTLALLAESYDRNHLREMVHPGIIGLIEQGRDDLIHTLEVYLANGGDARQAATDLYLHRSTMYYRLEKLTRAIGEDLGDGEIRFALTLGIRLAQLAGLYRPMR